MIDLLGIRAGVGKFGVDFGPDTLPQEAGLTSIVSVSKGCYVGQEVIARIHFRGHINKVLRPLTFAAHPPEAGTPLKLDGQTVGRVTSSITSRHTGPIGLGMISVGVPDQGKVTVDGHGEATVGPIPPGTKTDATPRRLGS